jgi:hypothetical protein
MASDLVKALWVGTPQAFVDGTPLVHGVTVQEIPAAEALASDNWQPCVDIDPFKGLKKGDLVALATERGVEIAADATVKQIKEALSADPEPDPEVNDGDDGEGEDQTAETGDAD